MLVLLVYQDNATVVFEVRKDLVYTYNLGLVLQIQSDVGNQLYLAGLEIRGVLR